jgi:hypothetical protein
MTQHIITLFYYNINKYVSINEVERFKNQLRSQRKNLNTYI